MRVVLAELGRDEDAARDALRTPAGRQLVERFFRLRERIRADLVAAEERRKPEEGRPWG